MLTRMRCRACRHTWTPRVAQPRSCPRCHRYEGLTIVPRRSPRTSAAAAVPADEPERREADEPAEVQP